MIEEFSNSGHHSTKRPHSKVSNDENAIKGESFLK
jgi:hypothetical protein